MLFILSEIVIKAASLSGASINLAAPSLAALGLYYLFLVFFALSGIFPLFMAGGAIPNERGDCFYYNGFAVIICLAYKGLFRNSFWMWGGRVTVF